MKKVLSKKFSPDTSEKALLVLIAVLILLAVYFIWGFSDIDSLLRN